MNEGSIRCSHENSCFSCLVCNPMDSWTGDDGKAVEGLSTPHTFLFNSKSTILQILLFLIYYFPLYYSVNYHMMYFTDLYEYRYVYV